MARRNEGPRSSEAAAADAFDEQAAVERMAEGAEEARRNQEEAVQAADELRITPEQAAARDDERAREIQEGIEEKFRKKDLTETVDAAWDKAGDWTTEQADRTEAWLKEDYAYSKYRWFGAKPLLNAAWEGTKKLGVGLQEGTADMAYNIHAWLYKKSPKWAVAVLDKIPLVGRLFKPPEKPEHTKKPEDKKKDNTKKK